MLDGENAYACELCAAKVATLKRVAFGTLPDTLTIHLKRFEMNYETWTKVKLNTECRFKETLDMWPYTTAGIEEASGAVPAGAPGTGGGRVGHTVVQRSDAQYRLSGILIHAGKNMGSCAVYAARANSTCARARSQVPRTRGTTTRTSESGLVSRGGLHSTTRA
jgi:hypothetical protein